MSTKTAKAVLKSNVKAPAVYEYSIDNRHNPDTHYRYAQISAIRNLSRIKPDNAVYLVQNEDSLEIWQGNPVQLAEYYRREEPWVMNENGKVTIVALAKLPTTLLL